MNSQILLKAVEADKDSHISLLQSFTQAPSPNRPGDTRAAANVLISYLHSLGITAEIIASQPHMSNIVSNFNFTTPGPRLIMNGHIDVFPANNGNDWARDPWSGNIANGRLHGRGTVDVKAGTAASAIAYSYPYRYREHLKGSLGLCAVSDEETGGKWGSKYLLEDERWRGDCKINAEPGGLGTILFAEKGTLRLTFVVRTEGAHGAYLHRSKSATKIAATLIEDLAVVEEIVPKLEPELDEYLRRGDVRGAINGAMGEGAADIVIKPTLNIGTIYGGLEVNMIPDKCVFEADIRLPTGLKADQVMEVIHGIVRRYPKATMEMQKAASNSAVACSHNHPMVKILARNTELVAGKRPLAILSIGATDCKFWRYNEVPAYVFGVSPQTMATRNESVSVDEFLAVVKTHVLAR
jgi:acetylornithine deacetylase/succinyl-diaminopimelate desuccinylase-like protein